MSLIDLESRLFQRRNWLERTIRPEVSLETLPYLTRTLPSAWLQGTHLHLAGRYRGVRSRHPNSRCGRAGTR